MAPHAAIAAETPQIDTAVDSITASSSSTRKRDASQNETYQTTMTTPSACTRPRTPACTTSENRIVAPMSTRPVLMKSSEEAAARTKVRVPPRWLTSNPRASAKMTYSMPHAIDAVLPASTSEHQASGKTNANPCVSRRTLPPCRATVAADSAHKPNPAPSHGTRTSGRNSVDNAVSPPHLSTGNAGTPPKRTAHNEAAPRMTAIQSS